MPLDFGKVYVWGDPIDEGALRQIMNCVGFADKAAMMADHHVGYAVPIGGVLAFRNFVSPSGVGYDIACGNKAVLTDLMAKDVREDIEAVMDMIWSNLSFGVGRKNNDTVDHALFDDYSWKLPSVSGLKQLARDQLGTIGSGNHYVDLLEDELGRVWVGVHFGSRGFGHKTAQWYLKKYHAKDGMFVDPLIIGANDSDYLEAMALAGKYAYAGRDWVCSKVVKLLGGKEKEFVHNHHNFAWRENHGGEDFWVVRKGATPAFPGQRGFIGGSMGDNAVIVEGVDSEESKMAMYSTVHGAGRVMSRTAAKKTLSKEEMHKWLQEKGVTLRGADLDEAPMAYKRIDEVLAHHSQTIKILHTLKPFGVAMAGKEDFDPYKD